MFQTVLYITYFSNIIRFENNFFETVCYLISYITRDDLVILYCLNTRSYVSKTAVKTVGQRCLNIRCLGKNKNGHQCRGILYDTILDWEHQLPIEELELSELHSK